MSKYIFAFVAFLLFATPTHAFAAPRVVVSIAPIHSLVAGVMEGVGQPELLLRSGNSPHNYLLKPSQMRSLKQADVVIWVGENVEGFLTKTVAGLDLDTTIIELMEVEGILTLPSREGGAWKTANAHSHHHHDHNSVDGHLWLDPINAMRMVQVFVAQLSEIDPRNVAVYQANGQRLQQQLNALDQHLAQTLAPIRQMPYLVLHDAYQYFERRYQLSPAGAVMIDAGRKPGARRLKEIRQRANEHNVRCVFSEPQFQDKFLNVVTEKTNITMAVLDPMGTDVTPGKKLYFEVLNGIALGLSNCFIRQ